MNMRRLTVIIIIDPMSTSETFVNFYETTWRKSLEIAPKAWVVASWK
jgi:hypothetical protein